MRVAIYARVSLPLIKKGEKVTAELIQVKQRQDLDNQLLPLQEYVTNKRWTLYKVYTDRQTAGGVRGSKRPSFNQMIDDARMARFDVILVWKIDRFARSMKDFMHWLEEIDRLEIRLISMTQGIDTDQKSPTGRLLLHIMAAFSEFERELIRERIYAAHATRRAKGLTIGREKVETDLDAILKLKREGKSIRDIATALGLKKSTVATRLGEIDRTIVEEVNFTALVEKGEPKIDWFGDVDLE